jgi:soluble lytic murein transglycosylase-like protein
MSGPLDLTRTPPAAPAEDASPAELDEQLLRRVRRWSRGEDLPQPAEPAFEAGAGRARKPWLPLLVLALVVGLGSLLALALVSLGGESLEATAAPEDGPKPAATARCPIPPAYRSAFVAAARDTDLPVALLVAVAEHESGFRPNAVSEAGAYGLLQVMPAAAEAVRLDAREPRQNVLAGARVLRQHLDRFHSTDLALAAYNAGPTAVARAGGAPTGETVTYVANVTRRWRELRGCT